MKTVITLALVAVLFAPTAFAQVGALTVETDPVGAAIYLDGRLIGQTPMQIDAGTLSAGDHRVRLVREGYLENARVVSMGGGARYVRVKLTPAGPVQEESLPTATETPRHRPKWPLVLGIAGVGAGGGALAAMLSRGESASATRAEVLSTTGQPSTPVANQAPTVTSFSVSPSTALVGTQTTFTAIGASDPDGDPLTFSWQFETGDIITSPSASPVRIQNYISPGTKSLSLFVSDGKIATTLAGSVVVKSLSGTWTGPLACCGNLATTVVLTQTNTAFTGTYADQVPADAGTIASGSINATSRQVTLNFRLNNGTGTWTLIGTLNTAATVLTGTTSLVSGFGPPNGTPWTLTRP